MRFTNTITRRSTLPESMLLATSPSMPPLMVTMLLDITPLDITPLDTTA